MSGAANWNGSDLVLRVRVQPRASRNEILDVCNGALRIRTMATPTDGKANKAVIGLLAEYLHVPPSRITLTHGHAHRNKRLIITGPVEVPEDLHVAGGTTNSL